MSRTQPRALRKDGQQPVTTFDRAQSPPLISSGLERRFSERVGCRIRALVVEFADASGAWMRYVVPTRNISRAGLSILTNQYIYPRTSCRVHLFGEADTEHAVAASVVRCRYLPGTGRLHEVGLRFDNPIEVEIVQRTSVDCRILLCEDDPSVHQVVPRLLNQQRVHVTPARSASDARRAIASGQFDIVLMNADLPGESGGLAVGEMRASGFARPIVALTTPSDPKTLRRCLEAGFTQIASRPLTRDSLTALVKSLQSEPVVSTLAHDASRAREIGALVTGMPERLGRIESAIAAAEMEPAKSLVGALGDEAGRSGFDVIAGAAAELQRALGNAGEKYVIRDCLTQLSKLALAAQAAPIEHC